MKDRNIKEEKEAVDLTSKMHFNMIFYTSLLTLKSLFGSLGA